MHLAVQRFVTILEPLQTILEPRLAALTQAAGPEPRGR